MREKYILARHGEEMVGTKFQKYFVSNGDSHILTTYTDWDSVKVFGSLDEALEKVKNLIQKYDEYGWYALDYERWNDKY
ncbi:hypothetical protein [Exiguobacterium sp. s133]|uniref:hypothetical protein n=1 Tax=Exiguobacterium sp. s133 TaxID=2751213 RepID=UPI001BE6BFE4|nr:hypothetical protein [Exiguobacterium sp. s133]